MRRPNQLLVGFQEFLEAGMAAQGVPGWVESEQRNRHPCRSGQQGLEQEWVGCLLKYPSLVQLTGGRSIPRRHIGSAVSS